MAKSTDSGATAQPEDERRKALDILMSALAVATDKGFKLTTSNDDTRGALVIRVWGARRDIDADGATVFSERPQPVAAAQNTQPTRQII